ncbi:flightin isoform X2 [Anoplophora glabripennis]|uniref:flightin isoform X2 n=1 Tax=Anoplophora glabripennis TaxID=217634 RepID=UPI0008746A3F|nr:flightin isoform X2 [Anoplophora glabripennis]
MEDDWFAGGDDEPPPTLKPLKKPGQEEEPPPPAEQEAPEGGEAPKEGELPPDYLDEDYLDPDRLLLFKHWIRPKFLPYKYISEYRRNYYDDIMEVLASRRKGIRRRIPPAQTWAERICRTRSNPVYKVEAFNRHLDDVKLVTKSEISGAFYNYYSKEQFNRRFSRLLF